MNRGRKFLLLNAALLFAFAYPLEGKSDAFDYAHCKGGLKKIPSSTLISTLNKMDRNCICTTYRISSSKLCDSLSRQYKIQSPSERFKKTTDRDPTELANSQNSNNADRPRSERNNTGSHTSQQQYFEQASDAATQGRNSAQNESNISKDVSSYSRETKGDILRYTAQELDRAAQDRSVPVKNLQNDYRIYQAASKSYEGSNKKENFNEDIAAKAKDEKVRELLLMFSSMDVLEKKAEESYAISQEKVANFTQMMKQNSESGRNLAQAGKEIAGNTSALSSKNRPAGALTGDIAKAAEASKVDSISSIDTTSGESKPKTEVARGNDSAQDGIRNRLREQLRAELAKGKASRGSAKEEELLGDFEGGLKGGLNGELASPRDSHGAAEALDQLIKTSDREPGFSMAHSDTDSFVKNALGEIDSIQSGILESESLDIFARVREYYQRCARSECVSNR